MVATTRLIPVSKFNEFHKYPTVAALRKLLFYRNINGLDKAVKKIGRKRLYIDEQEFFNWIDNQTV